MGAALSASPVPSPPRPAGNYQAWILDNDLLFISGQFPIENGQLRYCGRIGAELTEAQGREALTIAVNISTLDIQDQTLPARLAGLLSDYRVDPSRPPPEVTHLRPLIT